MSMNLTSFLASIQNKKTLEPAKEASTPMPPIENPHEESSSPPLEDPHLDASESIVASESSVATPELPQVETLVSPSGGSLMKLLATPKVPKESNIPTPRDFADQLQIERLSEMDVDDIVDVDATDRFKFQLDTLDRMLVKQGTEISAFVIDDVRKVIARIMIDLKENPDYMGLVLDRDVHNVMRFMWDTQRNAIEANAKKAGAAEKKALKGQSQKAMAGALGKVSFGDFDFS